MIAMTDLIIGNTYVYRDGPSGWEGRYFKLIDLKDNGFTAIVKWDKYPDQKFSCCSMRLYPVGVCADCDERFAGEVDYICAKCRQL